MFVFVCLLVFSIQESNNKHLNVTKAKQLALNNLRIKTQLVPGSVGEAGAAEEAASLGRFSIFTWGCVCISDSVDRFQSFHSVKKKKKKLSRLLSEMHCFSIIPYSFSVCFQECYRNMYGMAHHLVMWNWVAVLLALVWIEPTHFSSFVDYLQLSVFSCGMLEYFNGKFIIKKWL